MCQHCASAECVRVCPTGASYRREDGLVLVNRHLCIGCRYCMLACPYKARGFVHEKTSKQAPGSPRGMGTVEACTLCVHRIDAGGRPACVEACAKAGHGAMLFGNFNDPTDPLAKRAVAFAVTALRPELHTDPGVRYQGVTP
ncbi:MAG: 4Fe-4S dicluster domain-containing protein [Desulfovibrio sp.]|nr:4Fe-4S dicluster domain-containing protein [Desulfovibrio sp.]